MADEKYDVVVVGAGVVGALVARVLTEAGKCVLILEAGRAIGLTEEYRSYEAYKSNVDYFQRQAIKIPNSPYPPNPSAPSPYATDNVPIAPGTPDMGGYWVQMGPYPFMSSYLREEGGTTLHWMGSCPRLLPNDFHLEDTYGVGQDWPISYDDLQPYYCEAEWAVGVAGDRKETELYGSWFPEGYDYPMEPIPSSYLDQALAKKIEGKERHRAWFRAVITGHQSSRRAELDTAEVPEGQRQARRCPAMEWVPATRRSRSPACWPALRGEFELHSDLSGPGQIQCAEDAEPPRPRQVHDRDAVRSYRPRFGRERPDQAGQLPAV